VPRRELTVASAVMSTSVYTLRGQGGPVNGGSGDCEVPAFFLDVRSAQCELCGLGIDVLSEVVTTWAYTVNSEAFSELMVWRERGGRGGVCLYSHAMTRARFPRIAVLALLAAGGALCPVLSRCPVLPSPPSPQIIGNIPHCVTENTP
jgi:hypothetical protein